MIVVLLVLTGAILFIFIKNFTDSSFTIFSAAFAGASAEFILLVIFQILFGQIYRMIGLLFALYMAGLSAGTFIAGRYPVQNGRRSVLFFQVILLALVVMLPLMIYIKPVTQLSGLLYKSFIMLYTVLISFASGFLFGRSVSTSHPSTPLRDRDRDRDQDRASTSLSVTNRFYGIDLLASATGALLTSALLFPLAGIWVTAGFSTVILAASFVFNLRKRPI